MATTRPPCGRGPVEQQGRQLAVVGADLGDAAGAGGVEAAEQELRVVGQRREPGIGGVEGDLADRIEPVHRDEDRLTLRERRTPRRTRRSPALAARGGRRERRPGGRLVLVAGRRGRRSSSSRSTASASRCSPTGCPAWTCSARPSGRAPIAPAARTAAASGGSRVSRRTATRSSIGLRADGEAVALGTIPVRARHAPVHVRAAGRSAGGDLHGHVRPARRTCSPRQLASIRAQTHDNWICVISDDRSSPERFAALQAAVGDDPRFAISRSEQRLGFYANFERALELAPADADFVALADQDDAWHPDKLETLLGAIGDARLAYSDARIVARDGSAASETFWGPGATTTPTCSASWSPTRSPAPLHCSRATCSTTPCRSRPGRGATSTTTGWGSSRCRAARSPTSTGRSTTTSSTRRRRSATRARCGCRRCATAGPRCATTAASGSCCGASTTSATRYG